VYFNLKNKKVQINSKHILLQKAAGRIYLFGCDTDFYENLKRKITKKANKEDIVAKKRINIR
jgi:hypothetical protein